MTWRTGNTKVKDFPLKSGPVTCTIFLLTAVITGIQFMFPAILHVMQRTPATFSSGEGWRLITPIFINRGSWVEITLNLLSLAIVGAVAEHVWGGRRWLVFYGIGGLVLCQHDFIRRAVFA